MKKVMIIGYGSIGKRHTEVFSSQKCKVALVTSQVDTGLETYDNISTALENFSPDIILITNETSKHINSLNELVALNFQGRVFIEKPFSDYPTEIKTYPFKSAHVLYNLRMSPLFTELKMYMKSEKVVSANIYCGQYLPSWRPSRDYRETYSAKKSQGGGVIRDLSHELDYSTWLFGDFTKVAAIGGHLSSLEIDSDDVYHLIGKTAKVPALNITVNYLDRTSKRMMVINTDNLTFTLNFIKGELLKNDEILLSGVKTSDTYAIQARNILEEKLEDFCTLEHGNNVLKLIEAANTSSTEERFISL